MRKGFLKLRRTAQERMNIEDSDSVSPRSVINSVSRRSRDWARFQKPIFLPATDTNSSPDGWMASHRTYSSCPL